MNRFLAALALLLLAAVPAAAQTNVVWGLATGANPRNLCVYDSTHTCVTTGALDSTLHVFTPSIPGGTVTGGMLAVGAAAANLGFTPLNPANNLSDLASVATARTNLGLGTAATVNTGTSGATLCLLNGACVWSGADTFATMPTFTAGQLPPANGGTGLSTFTRSGNTTDFATATGTLTSGHCVSIDANGNFIDAGGACTTGGGGGTVTAGTVGQLAYYAGTTSTGSFALAGDCTFTYPNVTCTKTSGTVFSTLATLTPGTGVATALAAPLNATGGLLGYALIGTPQGSYSALTGLGSAANYVVGTSGATIPLLSTANTWALPQTFSGGLTASGNVLLQTPTNSLSQALTITQNLPSPSTATGSFNFNSIWVNYNGVVPSTSSNVMNMSVLQVNLATGAGFQNQYSEGQTDVGAFGLTPSASNTSLGDQVALSGGFWYPYSTLGRVYGIAGGGICPTGCSAPLIVGIESDISITGTGAAGGRVAFNAVNQGTAQASGTGDTAFQIATGGDGSSSLGAFKVGLYLQANSLDPAGILIRADYTGSLSNLIYMPNVTINPGGFIINLPSFTITGYGFVTAQSLRTYGATPSCSAGGVCYGGVVDATLSDCGSISGMTGCLQINVNGTMRYIPYK